MTSRSRSWFRPGLVAFLSFVAACSVVNKPDDPIDPNPPGVGGSGTGGSVPVNCGDGIVQMTEGEACDDSGESANCDDDCSLPECGDGNVNEAAGEACDDTVASAACNDDCTLSECGDGKYNANGGEQCDDSNTTPGDGCNDVCQAEGSCSAPIALDVSTGSTSVMSATGGVNGVPSAGCDGSPAGDGSDRVYKLTLTANSSVQITVQGQGFDVMARLLSAPCDPATEVPEASGMDGCVNAGGAGAQEALSYVGVPPGDYYVVVDGVGASDAGNFTLDVQVQSGCNWNANMTPINYSVGNAVGDMTFDSACNLYWVTDGGTLYKAAHNTNTAMPLHSFGSANGRGIVFNPANNLLYVAANLASGIMWTVTLAGQATAISTNPGVYINGLALAPPNWGNLGGHILMPRNNGAVYALNTSSNQVTTAGSTTGELSDLVFDGATLYVANNGQNQVQIMSPTGTFTTFATPPCPPDGLAVDSAGQRLFLSCSNSNQIYSLNLTTAVPTLVGTVTALDAGWAPGGLIWDGIDNLLVLASTPSRVALLTP